MSASYSDNRRGVRIPACVANLWRPTDMRLMPELRESFKRIVRWFSPPSDPRSQRKLAILVARERGLISDQECEDWIYMLDLGDA